MIDKGTRLMVELSDAADLNKRFPNYVFSKPLFRLMLLVLICLALTSLYFDGWSTEYVVCNNPGYDKSLDVWCEYAGQTIGDDRIWLTKYFELVALLLVGLSFGLNHLLYNWRDKK